MSSSRTEVGTFTTDASLTVRTWDDALARASGIDAKWAIGRPLAEVIPSIATRRLLTRFEEAVASGVVQVFSPSLHHYLLPCAPLVPSPRFKQMQQRATVGPLRDGDQITGVMVAIEDVTERLDAERDLAEALTIGSNNWKARRAVVEKLSHQPPADFALSLIGIIRAHHRDFRVLSSSLQLLAGTTVDLSEALIDLLEDADPDLRIQAALALGQQRSPAAEGALIRTLDDDNTNVRFQAIESLGRLRSHAAVDHLMRIAESENVYLAFAAIDALGAIKDPRVAAMLVALLERDELRPAVISALGSIGDEAAVHPLVRALNNGSDEAVSIADAIAGIYHRLEHTYQQGATVAHIVAASVDAAGVRHLIAAADITPQAAPAVARVLGWVQSPEARVALVTWLANPAARDTVLEMLPAHGHAIVPLLIDQLTAPNDEVRHAAVIALGQLALPDATGALIALIDEAPDLAGAVAGALARIAEPEAFEGLVALLAHADMSVRQAAVGALNSIGHPSMPARIATLLDSDSPLLRESAIRIAGYFGYPAARDRILQLTSDPVEAVQCAAIENVPFFDDGQGLDVLLAAAEKRSPGARAATVRALGRMDHDRARHALVEALHDKVFWVRYFAIRVLTEQRYAGAVGALRSAALQDDAAPVRIAAVEALALIDPDVSADVFIGLAEDRTDELAAAAVTALGRVQTRDGRAALGRAVHDHRRSVRLAALTALAAAPDRDTATVLQRTVTTDPEDDVRRAAVDALGDVARHGDQAGSDATAMLVAMLTDGDRGQDAAAALARLPAGRLTEVARHLQHPDSSTRRAVVETLGRSRYSEATTLLLDALNDDAAGVREAAVLALGRRRHVI